jgi:biopolymer transport protein ExbB/TolQ
MNYLSHLFVFIAGFVVSWVIRTLSIVKHKKESKSLKGFLERELLIKETMQKEHNFLQNNAAANILESKNKLTQAEELIRQMDHDIILLQKSNEETEALLAKGEPAIYDLKMKLIDAHNNLARFKAQHAASVQRSLKQTS